MPSVISAITIHDELQAKGRDVLLSQNLMMADDINNSDGLGSALFYGLGPPDLAQGGSLISYIQ